jgi:hypothetical protein
MPLDPRLLRFFVVLAEELHFGRAAARLNVAQPALSQRVRRLELQVGSRLYTRNSRAVVTEVAAYAESHPEVQLSVSRMYEPQGHEMLSASVLDVFLGTFAPTGSIIVQARSIDVPLLGVRGSRSSARQASGGPVERVSRIADRYLPSTPFAGGV